jgi:hypothetical protein
MDEVRAGIEAKVRATYEARLERELAESERELRRACDERIEQTVQEAVVAAEWEAYIDAQADWEPYLLADIEDRADAIRARYEALVQEEVERRLAARGQRRRSRPEGGDAGGTGLPVVVLRNMEAPGVT